jgi:hypothetical protein
MACYFFDKQETIQHRSSYRVSIRKHYLANSLYDSSVTPPKNISNLLGNWLKGIAKNDVKKVQWEFCNSLGHLEDA